MIGTPRCCGGCLGSRFHRSRRGRLRFLLKLVCVQPFRCDSCGRRVWRFVPLGPRPDVAPVARVLCPE